MQCLAKDSGRAGRRAPRKSPRPSISSWRRTPTTPSRARKSGSWCRPPAQRRRARAHRRAVSPVSDAAAEPAGGVAKTVQRNLSPGQVPYGAAATSAVATRVRGSARRDRAHRERAPGGREAGARRAGSGPAAERRAARPSRRLRPRPAAATAGRERLRRAVAQLQPSAVPPVGAARQCRPRRQGGGSRREPESATSAALEDEPLDRAPPALLAGRAGCGGDRSPWAAT